MALGRRRVEEEAEIDLTPMLDVVFIMLIFFIVTASFVNEEGLDISRPPITDSPPESDDQKRNIVLKVSETNEVWLEGRRIDVRSVRANVSRLLAENPSAKVIVQAHPKSKTDTFIKIADQAREAGVFDVSLATKK